MKLGLQDTEKDLQARTLK